MTLRSIVQLRIASALTTKPSLLSSMYKVNLTTYSLHTFFFRTPFRVYQLSI
jgi:hypothetical protein